jgi:hypothetical protein
MPPTTKSKWERLADATSIVGKWLHKHVDATLLIAAAVEIPRWCSTFAAINEPLIVGVPLGALLAYATSVAWKAYFEDTKRIGLAALNIVALVIAIFVITPVLFALTQSHDVKLTQVLPFELRWGWSGLLAITTFMPLIQLAAAKHATGASATKAAAQGGMVDATTATVTQLIDSGKIVADGDGFFIQSPLSPQEVGVVVRAVADTEMRPDAGASVPDTQVADDDTTTEAQLPDPASIPWTAVVAQPTDGAQPLDEMAQRILDAVASGARTPYAISKRTEIPLTTLKRKQGDAYIGRLPRMVAAGQLRNGGDEYKLVDNA